MLLRTSDVAAGRWRGILAALGVAETFLTGKHGPCPSCGGKDRFRYDDKGGRGTYYCTHCGPGDGMTLVQLVTGWDFKRAAAEVERLAGGVKPEGIKRELTDEEHRMLRRKLWQQSKPATMADPVGLYLRNRLGINDIPLALRYHPSLLYRNGDSRAFLPAMLAIVADAEGQPVTMHRTYLKSGGEKAAVEQAKKLLPGNVPDGAAIRLTLPARCLGIAEGIETAIAASLLTGVPCWAAVSAQGLAKWLPPAETKEVVVFADHDRSFTGQSAAFFLARVLAAKGIAVDVSIPPQLGDDWADVRTREITQEQPA